MELLVWNEEVDEEYADVYFKLAKFNNTFYKLRVEVVSTHSTIKVYIAASSGKKRRDLDVFDINGFKPDGGIKALLWLKAQIEKDVPELIESFYRVELFRTFIYIGWVNAQRRDVYSRLTKSGFYWGTDDRKKVLVKEIIYGESED